MIELAALVARMHGNTLSKQTNNTFGRANGSINDI
jgi:hypothetical protein